jgi:hypothetical protein
MDGYHKHARARHDVQNDGTRVDPPARVRVVSCRLAGSEHACVDHGRTTIAMHK